MFSVLFIGVHKPGALIHSFNVVAMKKVES